jgi:Domain of Unknown Function (DUF1080)
MLRLSFVLCVLFVPFMHAEDPKTKAPEWKTLFDGKSLDGWKKSFDRGSGKIEVKDGAIVMGVGEKMTGVTYSKNDFPKTDYEVVFEGKRVEGRDFFATATFPVGDNFCSLVTGGWGGMVTGISSINGADASENESTGSTEFKTGQWYKFRVRVTAKKIEAWIGDEKAVDVELKGRKVSTRIECEDCQPFGFCTWDTTGAVREIKVRRLTEEEKK